MSSIIFSKMTDNRREEFRICTTIFEKNGKRYVRKAPSNSKAVTHILNMKKYSDLVHGESVWPVSCELDGEDLIFPYVEGSNLCEIALEFIRKNERRALVELLLDYRDYVYALGVNSSDFVLTEKFKEIFGDVSLEFNARSGEMINIDCIFENMICVGDHIEIIDYEWFFDFPIPYNFVIFRAIFDLFTNYSLELNQMLDFGSVLSVLGISQEEMEVYNSMNDSFNKYVFDNYHSFQMQAKRYSQPVLDIEGFLNNSKIFAQVYYDSGAGFTEEDSLISEIYFEEYSDMGIVKREWRLPERDYERIRIDPINANGIVSDLSIQMYDTMGNIVPFSVSRCNGITLDQNNCILFYVDDASIEIIPENKTVNKIILSMKAHILNDQLLNNYCEKRERFIQEKDAAIQCAQNRIIELESNIEINEQEISSEQQLRELCMQELEQCKQELEHCKQRLERSKQELEHCKQELEIERKKIFRGFNFKNK